MKKIFFNFIITLLFCGYVKAQNMYEASYSKINGSETTYIKEWLKNNYISKFNQKLTFLESYKGYNKKDNYYFNTLEVNENLFAENSFNIKSYVIHYKPDYYEYDFLFIQRVISFKESVVVQLISLNENEIIDIDLINITEDDYFSNTFKLPGGGKKPICYKSFNSCFKSLTTFNNPRDQALSDWLPTNTIAYVCCTIASGEGYIQNESDFIGASNCSAIYRMNVTKK